MEQVNKCKKATPLPWDRATSLSKQASLPGWQICTLFVKVIKHSIEEYNGQPERLQERCKGSCESNKRLSPRLSDFAVKTPPGPWCHLVWSNSRGSAPLTRFLSLQERFQRKLKKRERPVLGLSCSKRQTQMGQAQLKGYVFQNRQLLEEQTFIYKQHQSIARIFFPAASALQLRLRREIGQLLYEILKLLQLALHNQCLALLSTKLQVLFCSGTWVQSTDG